MIATADLLDQQACQKVARVALAAAGITTVGWPGSEFQRPTDGVYAEVEVTVPPSGRTPQHIGPSPTVTTVGVLSVRVAYPAASGVLALLTAAGTVADEIWQRYSSEPGILFEVPTVARGGDDGTHRAARVLVPFQSWRPSVVTPTFDFDFLAADFSEADYLAGTPS